MELERSAGEPFAHLRFLVVEDHSFQRWALGQLLTKLGATNVLNAGDGEAALELYSNAKPPVDVVITDLDMPGLDGMAVIRGLAGMKASASLIVATQKDPSLLAVVESMAEAYGINLLGAISKPVTAKKLMDLLSRHDRPVDRTIAVWAEPGHEFPAADVVAGIEAGQFEPLFRPVIDVTTSEVRGVSALAYWRHALYGPIGPGVYALALGAELRRQLNKAVVSAAIAAQKSWRAGGVHVKTWLDMTMAAHADIALAGELIESVRRSGLDARDFVLEFDEADAAAPTPGLLENMSRLRMHGFGICVRNFSGHAAASELRRIPLTELKLSSSLVARAPSDVPSRKIVEFGREITREMGWAASAAGVHNAAQMDVLRAAGYDLVQGDFVERLMREAEFLTSGNWGA